MTRKQFEPILNALQRERITWADMTPEAIKYARKSGYAAWVQGAPGQEAYDAMVQARGAKLQAATAAQQAINNDWMTRVKAAFAASGVEFSGHDFTNGRSFYGYFKGRKVRVSDHSTGLGRWMVELQFTFNSASEIPAVLPL